MSLESHLAELKRKHGELEREIDNAKLHPSVDELDVAQLKRRKLAIKDEMEKLKSAVTRH
ncbi:YdcH family protein [Nitratireductor sp. L15S-10]|uniref:YdcH family protein n=1 Tax=Nitratireductor sp. L15S-10 TaxID=3034028 RepID=UPI003857EDB1